MAWNILVVEADASQTEAFRQAFEPAGFQVSALAAGEAAVERCRTSPPDLILLSAELPDMSGFSVCNRLRRAHPANSLTPTVFGSTLRQARSSRAGRRSTGPTPSSHR